MKIYSRKEFLKGCFLIIFASLWLSCEDEREIPHDKNAAINQQVLDPYVQVTTGFVSFQPGTPEYNIKFNVINGVKALNKVNVYTTFNDAATGLPSNERLIGTYDVTSPYRNVISDNLTYTELREGLTVNGQPLPEADADVAPGSGWVYRFEGVDAAGNAVPLLGAINMVFSKYAGLYKVIESHYYRIAVDNGDWNGEERFIGHVDDVTLSYNDAWGPFPWAGASFHFTVDPTTKAITVPVLTDDGIYAGDRAISCKTDKGTFKSTPCDGSNILVEDEATGKHKIYITYGYFTENAGVNTGPREFYEVLEKIVD